MDSTLGPHNTEVIILPKWKDYKEAIIFLRKQVGLPQLVVEKIHKNLCEKQIRYIIQRIDSFPRFYFSTNMTTLATSIVYY